MHVIEQKFIGVSRSTVPLWISHHRTCFYLQGF